VGSPFPLNTDYTEKDRESIYARLRNLIRSVFPQWTEESVADFGNILLGGEAHIGDLAMYYLDRAAREGRFSTALLRRSLLAHCKLIGFEPRGATAAQVSETFTLDQVYAGTVTIPKGDIVKTAEVTEPLRYQLLADLVFTPGETTKDAAIEHSAFAADTVLHTGLPNQVFVLKKTPFLEGSLAWVAGNGTFTRVDNFLDAKAVDKHFTVSVDANDKATVRFGNGINGTIPTGTGAADYKTGGGAKGRVEPGALKLLEKTYSDSLGNPVRVTVTNATASNAGEDKQTNAQIKELGPRSLRVLGRAVAREDFEIVAELTAGCARALFLTKDKEESIAENSGILFVVPNEGGTPSPTLLTTIAARFGTGGDYPKQNTFQVAVQAAAYRTYDIQAKAWKAAGVTGAAMKAAIVDVLTTFFAIRVKASYLVANWPELAAAAGVTAADGDALVKNPRINFGFYFQDASGLPTGLFPWSDVFNVVRDVPQVRKVGAGAADFLINGVRDDAAIGPFDFPVLGSVIVIDGDTGATL